MFGAERRGEMICGLDPVLQRQDTGARPDKRPNPTGGLLHLPCFHAHEDNIDFTDLGKIVCRLGRCYDEVTQYAVHPQTVRSNGLQMGATCHEHHIVTGSSEPSSKVPAHAAGAEYRNAHT